MGLKFFETFIANDFSNLIDQSIIEPSTKSNGQVCDLESNKSVQRKSKLSPRSHFLFHKSYTPSLSVLELNTDSVNQLELERKKTNALLNQVTVLDQTHFVSRIGSVTVSGSENKNQPLIMIQLRHLCASCETANCLRLFPSQPMAVAVG